MKDLCFLAILTVLINNRGRDERGMYIYRRVGDLFFEFK